MAGEPDGFPPIISYLIYFGGGLGLFFGWLFGGRKRGESGEPDAVAVLAEEVARIKARESNRVERERTDHDLAEIRRDFEEIIKQARLGLENRIDSIKLDVAGLQELKGTMDGLKREMTGLRQQVARLSRKQPK